MPGLLETWVTIQTVKLLSSHHTHATQGKKSQKFPHLCGGLCLRHFLRNLCRSLQAAKKISQGAQGAREKDEQGWERHTSWRVCQFFIVFLNYNFHHFLPRILAIQNGDMWCRRRFFGEEAPPPAPCFRCNPSLVQKVMRNWQDGVASWWSQNQLQNKELCLGNDPHITQSESI